MKTATKPAKNMELAIQIKGEITTSNFTEFESYAIDKIDGMNYALLTDDDFTKAAADVKILNTFEKNLDEVGDSIFKQMDDVYAQMEGLKNLKAKSRACRLGKSTEIKERKAALKTEIITAAVDSIEHDSRAQFKSAIESSLKGMSSFENMGKAAVNKSAIINAGIEACRAVLESFQGEHGKSLIPDASTLELGDAAQLKNELAVRLERHQAETERKKLLAERSKVEADLAELKAKDAKQDEIKEPVKPVDPVVGPSVGVISVGETVDAEMERYTQAIITAFAPVKAHRLSLKHDENKDKAKAFSDALVKAYGDLKL